MIDRKFIIQTCFQNKLFWTAAWLKGKGIEVKCPGTTNLSAFAPLSEYEMGRKIGTQLGLLGMLVKCATMRSGIDHALKGLHSTWNVKRLADPTHQGQCQFRQYKRATFSREMFPGEYVNNTRKHRRSSVKI